MVATSTLSWSQRKRHGEILKSVSHIDGYRPFRQGCLLIVLVPDELAETFLRGVLAERLRPDTGPFADLHHKVVDFL